MLKRPLGSGVEPKLEVNGIDALNLIGIKGHVVLTACVDQTVSLGLYSSTVKCNNGRSIVACDNDLLGKLGVVTLLVSDLEGDVVCTVGKCDTCSGELACGKLGVNLVTVNIYLSGSLVETRIVSTVTGILCSVSSNCNGIVVKCSAVDCKRILVLKDKRIGDDRHVSVIYSVTVIKSNVIDVECTLLCTGCRRGNDELNECGSIVGVCRSGHISVCILIIRCRNVCLGDLLHIYVYVSPTCFGDLVAGQLREALFYILICKIEICSIDLA